MLWAQSLSPVKVSCDSDNRADSRETNSARCANLSEKVVLGRFSGDFEAFFVGPAVLALQTRGENLQPTNSPV